MTCRHAELQLNALADQELSPWQAARVRRHLATCPACAAEFAEIQRLDASVQAWRDAPAPSSLGSRIAAALPPSAVFQTPRRTFPLRPAAVGLAGIAAAVAAAFWFLPGQPGQPTIAFADVQRAMQQVQIASWETQSVTTDANWREVSVHDPAYMGYPAYTTWVRRRPEAIATRNQPPGLKVLEDERGTLKFPVHGRYKIRLTGKTGRKTLMQEVESDFKEVTNQTAVKPGIDSHPDWSTVTHPPQQVVLDGEKRVLFSADTDMVIHVHGHVIPSQGAHYFWHRDIWVNPATYLVTRIETRVWGSKQSGQFNQRQIFVENNFQYNQNPPPGVFDWSPPKGAKVEYSTPAQEAQEARRMILAYRKAQK